MADTVVELRPSSILSNTGWGGPPEDVDMASDWSDNDDATWWEQEVSGGWADMNLDNLALPSLAVVRSLTVQIRASDPNNTGGAYFALWLPSALAGSQFIGNTPILDATVRNYVIGTVTSLNGHALTDALVDGLRFYVAAFDSTAPGTQHHRVYEASVAVAYNQAPVATVTGPSGSIVDTNKPTVEWTYSDPEGDAQERVRIKVFSAAQYSAGGFDPETSTATWSSGAVLTAELSRDVSKALANGATYKAYAKVADVGSGGRYGPWDGGPAFTMATDPPATPEIASATPDSATASITLSVRGHDNELTVNQASLETDTTGWQAGVNSTIARTTAAAYVGLASLELTSVAAGDMTAITTAATAMRTWAGHDYTHVARLRRPAGHPSVRSCRVAIVWREEDGTVIQTDYGSVVAVDDSGWFAVSVTAESPSNVYDRRVIVEVQGTAGASEVMHVDGIVSRPGTSTTWSPGGFLSTQTMTIERSDDDGTTWKPIRVSVGIATIDTIRDPFDLNDPGQFRSTVVDHEAPPGVAVQYRAQTFAVVGGLTVTSDWSDTVTATLTLTDLWLKDVDSPSRNMVINLEPGTVISRRQKVGVFDPLGAEYPIVRTDGRKGEAGDNWPVNTFSKAEHDALDLLLSPGRNLLLQLLSGEPQRFVAVVGGNVATTQQVMRDEDDQWQPTRFSWIQIAEPA